MTSWSPFPSRSNTIDSLYSPTSDHGSTSAPQNIIQSPDGSEESSSTEFDYLHFAKFLAFRNIEIIPLSQLTDSKSGENIEDAVKQKGKRVLLDLVGGTSFAVVRAKWKGKTDVALKVAK